MDAFESKDHCLLWCQVNQLFRVIGKNLPFHSLSIVRDYLHSNILSTPLVTGPFDHTDVHGHITNKSTAWQQIESFTQVVEPITATISPQQLSQPDELGHALRELCVSIVGGLLTWAPLDPLLLWLKLALLAQFRTFYSVQSAQLWDVMDIAFQCLEFGDPDHLETSTSACSHYMRSPVNRSSIQVARPSTAASAEGRCRAHPARQVSPRAARTAHGCDRRPSGHTRKRHIPH